MFLKILFAGLLFISVLGAQTSSPAPYPIDANHSTIGFNVPILNGLSKVSGKFTDFTVTLNHDQSDVTRSSVNVVIKAASINTGIAARDNHLKTADFFDVEKYPEITFKSTRIDKKGKQLILVGTLTMHGVSKEIAMPFVVKGPDRDEAKKKMVVGYSASLPINRRDFGVNWEHPSAPGFVGDNIEIEINLITKEVEMK